MTDKLNNVFDTILIGKTLLGMHVKLRDIGLVLQSAENVAQCVKLEGDFDIAFEKLDELDNALKELYTKAVAHAKAQVKEEPSDEPEPPGTKVD